MKKHLLCSLLLCLSASVQAQSTAHIADDVYVFMHGGPGTQYRITGRINSGEPVTILQRSQQYVEVRSSAGRSGWVPEEFVKAGESMQTRLPRLESELEQSRERLQRQNAEIETLNTQLENVSGNSRDYARQIEGLEAHIRQLEGEIANMDQSNLIRWLTHGGLVALGGVILGLLVPYMPKRRKRRDEWF